ncbi:MAG: thioredoxin [Christensenellales bacterium]
MSKKALRISEENFNDTVLSSELPVLVDFWAEWCAPCRMIAPVIEQVAAEYEQRAVVGKINIDEESELAGRYGVMSIPTLILFKNGEIKQKSVGVVGKDKITAMIDSALK